ncbi:MAG: hypothetical protein CM15mP74_14620 [Halieaceae bacterium]|nr:MAG: hypothetical protein CM15mP74_14620 [Halieaceae bacterium]
MEGGHQTGGNQSGLNENPLRPVPSPGATVFGHFPWFWWRAQVGPGANSIGFILVIGMGDRNTIHPFVVTPRFTPCSPLDHPRETADSEDDTAFPGGQLRPRETGRDVGLDRTKLTPPTARGFYAAFTLGNPLFSQVAQLVEQWIENPRGFDSAPGHQLNSRLSHLR